MVNWKGDIRTSHQNGDLVTALSFKFHEDRTVALQVLDTSSERQCDCGSWVKRINKHEMVSFSGVVYHWICSFELTKNIWILLSVADGCTEMNINVKYHWPGAILSTHVPSVSLPFYSTSADLRGKKRSLSLGARSFCPQGRPKAIYTLLSILEKLRKKQASSCMSLLDSSTSGLMGVGMKVSWGSKDFRSEPWRHHEVIKKGTPESGHSWNTSQYTGSNQSNQTLECRAWAEEVPVINTAGPVKPPQPPHSTCALHLPDWKEHHSWLLLLWGMWSAPWLVISWGKEHPKAIDSIWTSLLVKRLQCPRGIVPNNTQPLCHLEKTDKAKLGDILQNNESILTRSIKGVKDKARPSSCHRHEEIQDTQKLNTVQALGLVPGPEKEH